MERKFALGWAALCVVLAVQAAHAQSSPEPGGEITFTGEGIVVPARSWDISAETSNRIRRIHFVQGQMVKEGDLLVEFHTRWKTLELDRAEAALAVAEGRMRSAQDDLARQEKLKLKDVVAIATYNDALFDAESAKAEYRVAQVEREMASALLAAQKLHAPFDGQMSKPRYRENAQVDIAEGTEIATVVQLDPIHVEIPTTYDRMLLWMREGVPEDVVHARIDVALELPDGSTYPHRGRILTSGYELDPEKGTYAVLVEFPNPDRILRPGLRVIATAYQKP